MTTTDAERVIAALRQRTVEKRELLGVRISPDLLCVEAADLIDSLSTRIKEMEGALEPFAEAAESLDESTRDRDEIWEMGAAMSISAGDLRRARSALDGKKE